MYTYGNQRIIKSEALKTILT